jgi:hypothetical protein
MMQKVSEVELGTTFERVVGRSGKGLRVPRLPVLLREFEARQGRADYVGVHGAVSALQRASDAGWGRVLARPAASAVFARTSFAPRTVGFFARTTGLTIPTIRSCVADLLDSGLVTQTATRSIVRAPVRLPEPELWAFEIKVTNWRRALFQATQYQAFAHCVAIVLPANIAHRAFDHRTLFRRLGVGLLVIDLLDGEPKLRCEVAPRRRKPSSGAYYLHALGRIIDRANEPAT